MPRPVKVTQTELQNKMTPENRLSMAENGQFKSEAGLIRKFDGAHP